MKLHKINRDFSICKINNIDKINFTNDFVFVAKTDDEISLVCETKYAPIDALQTETGYKALKILGILDFGLTGVISKITNILAQADIPVFVVSTYNTDYIFLKSIYFDKAIQKLIENEYVIS